MVGEVHQRGESAHIGFLRACCAAIGAEIQVRVDLDDNR